MFRFNNGILITNDNCIGCNYCISQCSIMGANISATRNGKKIIAIDSDKCNHCGKCIALCIHNAREYVDDTDEFFQALNNGENISLVIDPSFYFTFGDLAGKITQYFRSIGIKKVYDSSFGSEISIWATVKYLKDNYDKPAKDKAFIVNTCPAFINVVEMKYPQLMKKVIPVQSGPFCTAIYAHKYLNDTNKIAYLGPCIAKKDEIITKNTHNSINYNLTFNHIWQKIKDTDFSQYEDYYSDIKPIGFGRFTIRTGFYKTMISRFFSVKDISMVHSGAGDPTFKRILMYINSEYENLQPLLAEVYACTKGCFEGPGTETSCYKDGENFSRFLLEFKKYFDQFGNNTTDYKESTKNLFESFKEFTYEDFHRDFSDRYIQPYHIPDSVYNDIFNSMLKTKEEKRHIDCGMCGYKTCKNMATAIAYSYTKKENCIHYMNDEMRHRLYTDSVANCPNRQAFTEKVTSLLEQNPDKNYRLYCGDINKYKVINELFGNDIGDAVLRTISTKLGEVLGPDAWYARITSGQFAFLIEETIDNIQKIINLKSFDCSSLGINYPITMRFGFYSMQENADKNDHNVNNMINSAILAMDQRVTQQENTYSAFTQSLKQKQHDEARLSTLMKSALDNNEFVLWFQPQYSTATNKLVGAEALCRWINKEGQIISPSIFIPVTEKNGFIRYLDKEIWRKAFSMLRRWIDEGYEPVPVSINISRVSLESEGIYYTIKYLKDEYQIPPELVHFEITESAYIGDEGNFLQRINQIRSLGFKIAMDDFGSGYSSLNSLKDIPIDIIKLDMGFLNDSNGLLPPDNSNTQQSTEKGPQTSLINRGGTIISSVIRMAQKLKYITIAEGVEKEEQALFLKSIGCDIIQGFLYAKPMPEDAYIKLLKEKEKQFEFKSECQQGQFEIARFINPTTQESYVFDHFVGAALIVEYNMKKAQTTILRTNNQAKELFGVAERPFDVINNLFSRFTRSINGKSLKYAFEEATKNQNEVKCEVRIHSLSSHDVKHIRSHIWQINTNGTSYVFYVMFEDISEYKLLEESLEKD